MIIVAWMCIGFTIGLCDHFLLFSNAGKGSTEDYSFMVGMFINIGAGFTSGLIAGSILVFYVNERFRNEPYWVTVFLVAAVFVVVFIFIVLLVGILIIPLVTGRSLLLPEGHDDMVMYISDTGHYKNAIIWGSVVALTQFALQINDKFGQGVLWKMVRGRYQKPRHEERIFMFVDLMSSTAIAELLGNEKYHMLLKDYFADITNSIIYNKGEIYQYIGDEIVISWKLEAGVTNNNCLECYFDMRKSIFRLKEKYESRYGLVPDFKAGIHYGHVIAGEIGIIKRDITYSGDVMNTTSRIQGMCNELKVKLLCSDDLLTLLPVQERFKRISLGDIELKGKQMRVALSTVEV